MNAQQADQAAALLRQGRFAEVEQLYGEILAAAPGDARAHLGLGILRQNQNRSADAIAQIEQALRLAPDDIDALMHYGLALGQAGRGPDALGAFERAGALLPDNGDIWLHRARALEATGQVDAAMAAYDRAVDLMANSFAAFHLRGEARIAAGRFAEGLADTDKAIAIKPDFIEAWINRGVALRGMGRLEDAVANFTKVLAMRPGHAPAFTQRGIVLFLMDSPEQALKNFDTALGLAPQSGDAHLGRGVALQKLRRQNEALACFDRALAARPDYPEAWHNRGIALEELGQSEEALASYDKALSLRPDYTKALNNRAVVLQTLRRFTEAAETYRKIQSLGVDDAFAVGGIANCALHACHWDRSGADLHAVENGIRANSAVIGPGTFLAMSEDKALQRRCARNFLDFLIPQMPPPLWQGAAFRNPKIRLAYLSADLHQHATASLMAELFECHDRERFEIMAISFGEDDQTPMRRRLVQAFDQFHDVREQSDRAVAEFMHAQKIDIAIDLKGHTRDARPMILAHRPAPLQINYLGYPGTLAADFIDYIIADPVLAPLVDAPFYAEKIVQLPDCYQANDARRAVDAATPSRAEAGLPPDGFVFCCFNNNWKISPALFEIWMRLLAAVDGSILWLIEDNGEARDNLRREAALAGIDPARLVFASRIHSAAHLARHRLADLFIDTLPYNAHTTASDSLWVGVPLVTCRGHAFAGRVAASLLKAAGLPELVTETLAAYEALALKLAREPLLLASYRNRLVEGRATAILFDTARFRHHLEAAYGTMWERWQRGEAPASFAVADTYSA